MRRFERQELVILKAIGVNPFGIREVLGLSARISEAEVHWREFLEGLHRQGLRGIELFVSDDPAGRLSLRSLEPLPVHLSQNAQQYARRSAWAPRPGCEQVLALRRHRGGMGVRDWLLAQA